MTCDSDHGGQGAYKAWQTELRRSGGDVKEASGASAGYRLEGEGGHEILLFR